MSANERRCECDRMLLAAPLSYNHTPGCVSVRAAHASDAVTPRQAARDRQPLDGADAQALEGALTAAERECDTYREEMADAALRADTDAKAKAAWESLYKERNRLWMAAQFRLDRVRDIIDSRGCDYGGDCDNGSDCFACRIYAAVEE